MILFYLVRKMSFKKVFTESNPAVKVKGVCPPYICHWGPPREPGPHNGHAHTKSCPLTQGTPGQRGREQPEEG